ncbi:DegT/DnrJ/EryC1/StrS family aminotransferase [Frigoribacterium sp. 2-23]|uniref:DegT/DnrJ/EryC1/StrS family aminotransferase n=1 Tax=Frigoribacterium sp. 2-23 TaxID=3415006 RepID=UPI003C705F2C
MTRIALSSPDVGVAEADAAARAVRSGWVAPLGPEVDAFEREMADYIGRQHAIALSSGTAALHLALITHGVGPGMVVPTSTFTFAATANAIAYTGAEPFFVDVDPATGNLCPDLLAEALDRLKREGRRVGAVMPVDILGKAVDHAALEPLAAAAGAPLLLDSAEGVGASYQGRRVGSFGSAAALSFNGNKIMTTSGGGMLLTDDAHVAETARRISTQARQPVRHYEHTEVGFNYRLSNVLAAVGRAQLDRLESMMLRRREIRERYRAVVATVAGVEIFGGHDDVDDNCWLTSIVIDPTVVSVSAADLMTAFDAADIEVRNLWKPMHLQPVFRGLGSLVTGAAERLFATGLTLPSGSGMTDAEIDRVCSVLYDALQGTVADRRPTSSRPESPTRLPIQTPTPQESLRVSP